MSDTKKLTDEELKKVTGGGEDVPIESSLFAAYAKEGIISVEFFDMIEHKVKLYDLSNQIVSERKILVSGRLPVRFKGIYIIEVDGSNKQKITVC